MSQRGAEFEIRYVSGARVASQLPFPWAPLGGDYSQGIWLALIHQVRMNCHPISSTTNVISLFAPLCGLSYHCIFTNVCNSSNPYLCIWISHTVLIAGPAALCLCGGWHRSFQSQFLTRSQVRHIIELRSSLYQNSHRQYFSSKLCWDMFRRCVIWYSKLSYHTFNVRRCHRIIPEFSQVIY